MTRDLRPPAPATEAAVAGFHIADDALGRRPATAARDPDIRVEPAWKVSRCVACPGACITSFRRPTIWPRFADDFTGGSRNTVIGRAESGAGRSPRCLAGLGGAEEDSARFAPEGAGGRAAPRPGCNRLAAQLAAGIESQGAHPGWNGLP